MVMVTIAELLDAVYTINKFVRFGEKVSEVISALARSGIDISRVKPYDLNSILAMAVSMQNRPELKDIDVDELREEFKEILEIDLHEVRKKISTINTFLSTYSQATGVVNRVSRTMGTSLDQLNMIASMFGIKTPQRKPEKEEEEEEVEIQEMTEEELKELEEAINKFKSK